MYVRVSGWCSRTSITLALSTWLWAACGSDGEDTVRARKAPDGGTATAGSAAPADPDRGCDSVQLDGELVVEHEKDFTARFRMGAPYTKTMMLFGGEPVETENVFSNAYIFGLDKADALMLAKKYPDFYMCSSPGGQEAADYIIPYDLVPATCEVYDQLVTALRQYRKNSVAGGDRTSLRLEGAPLQLESVTADATGNDATDQVTDQDFHLVTAVQQLTGESVVAFGTTE
jgi:hypothetical protein